MDPCCPELLPEFFCIAHCTAGRVIGPLARSGLSGGRIGRKSLKVKSTGHRREFLHSPGGPASARELQLPPQYRHGCWSTDSQTTAHVGSPTTLNMARARTSTKCGAMRRPGWRRPFHEAAKKTSLVQSSQRAHGIDDRPSMVCSAGGCPDQTTVRLCGTLARLPFAVLRPLSQTYLDMPSPFEHDPERIRLPRSPSPYPRLQQHTLSK